MKNFPSVEKMAATVYERDNCSGEDARGKGELRVFFRAFRVSAPQVARVAIFFPRAFKTRDLETPLSLGIFTYI